MAVAPNFPDTLKAVAERWAEQARRQSQKDATVLLLTSQLIPHSWEVLRSWRSWRSAHYQLRDQVGRLLYHLEGCCLCQEGRDLVDHTRDDMRRGDAKP